MSKLDIKNWPFATKFAVPTVASLSMIGVLAGVSHFSLQAQSDRTDTIVERDMMGALTLVEANSQIQTINGKLYKYLTYQAAEISESGNPATEVAALGADVDATLAQLQAYRRNARSESEAKAVQEIEAELTTYKETIDIVASMMEIDFSAAVSFAQPFAANYENLQAKFDTLVQEAQKASRASADQGAKDAANAGLILIGTALVALCAAGFMAFMVGNATRRSIRQIADATEDLASGNLAVEIERLSRGDELSAIVQALETFKLNAIERNRLTEEQAANMKAREERAERVENLIHQFESDSGLLLESVTSASNSMRTTAEHMRENAEGTTQQSEVASNALGQAAHDVQAVAAASEELSSSIQEIEGSVTTSMSAVESAASKADQANSTMQMLTESARRIDNVVNLINDIAEQTNLLALNATIEAARAGEAGKGFAVVASEVKSLANQTSQATNQVADSVKDIQRVTEKVATAMNEIITTISSVAELSTEISNSVHQQGSATLEIAESVSRVSNGTNEVSDTMTNVRMSATDTGHSADDVLGAAAELQEQAKRMQASVGQFLSGIRAA